MRRAQLADRLGTKGGLKNDLKALRKMVARKRISAMTTAVYSKRVDSGTAKFIT